MPQKRKIRPFFCPICRTNKIQLHGYVPTRGGLQPRYLCVNGHTFFRSSGQTEKAIKRNTSGQWGRKTHTRLHRTK